MGALGNKLLGGRLFVFRLGVGRSLLLRLLLGFCLFLRLLLNRFTGRHIRGIGSVFAGAQAFQQFVAVGHRPDKLPVDIKTGSFFNFIAGSADDVVD